MAKPVRSPLQNLSVSYECALAIGKSLNLSEMLRKVIYTMVHKTNAHRGIIWVKNGEKKFQPVASAGINIEDVLAQSEIMDLRDVLDQIQKRQQYILRCKEDKDFLQYCPVLTEKEESVLIVPVTHVAILYLVYASREIADEPLANLLASLSEKLGVSIEACMAHKNILHEVQERAEAEEELKNKTEQLISREKELQRLYGESEQARKSLLSILEDITQKEEALRESEEKYRLLADNSIDIIWQTDLKLIFTYVSPSVKKIMGYTVEEWVGSRLSQHSTTKEFVNMSKKALYAIKHYKEFKHLTFDAVMRRKDGTEIPVEITGKLLLNKKGLPIGLQGTTSDITERKRANEALMKSEQRFRFITENTGDVLYRLQYDTMIFDYLSPAIYALTGYTDEEINKITFQSIINKTVILGATDLSSEELKKKRGEGKTDERRAEYRILSKGGEEKWLEDHSFPWKDDSGKTIGSTGILQNITERKQAEEEEKEHIRNIELLSETAMQFAEFPQDKDIYTFIGEKLKESTGENSIIVVNSIDTEKDILTNRTVLGLGKLSDKIAGLLGKHPVGMTFDVKDQILSALSDGKLHLNEEGLYGIFLKTVPKTVCNSIEKLLNIKKVYGMGFTKNDKLFGTVVIFSREGTGELKNKQTVEAFLKQASIAVQKRQVEEALLESEEKMRTILNSMPDIILQLDTNLKTLWANEATIEMKPDVIGQFCYEALLGRNDLCPNCPIVKALKTGQIERGIVHLQSVAGVGESYWDTVGVPIKDAQGKIISMVNLARNVTERIRAEEEIHKLSHAVEQSPSIVMITDTKSIIEYVNPKFTQVTGYDSEEIIGKNAGELGKQTPEEFERMWSVITSGGEWQGEFRNKKKNGEIYWESASISSIRNPEGVITNFIKVAEDISERKQAEEELKKRMNELEIFNDASVDRELKINELRKEINELLKKSGKEAKYEIAE